MSFLVFTGAGASAELGIPTMRPMALEFLQHLRDLAWASSDYELVETTLVGEDQDMEHLIDRVDRLRNGFVEQEKLGMPIDSALLTRLASITREAEWFVQHTCEQLLRIKAEALWRPFFEAARELPITLATTNYDRAI